MALTAVALHSLCLGALVPRRAVLHNAGQLMAIGITSSSAGSALAYAGEGSMSKEEVLKLADKLTPFERAVALDARTERSFTGRTTNGYAHDNKLKGTYVGRHAAASSHALVWRLPTSPRLADCLTVPLLQVRFLAHLCSLQTQSITVGRAGHRSMHQSRVVSSNGLIQRT